MQVWYIFSLPAHPSTSLFNLGITAACRRFIAITWWTSMADPTLCWPRRQSAAFVKRVLSKWGPCENGKIMLLKVIKCQVPAYLLFYTAPIHVILWPTYTCSLFYSPPVLSLWQSNVAFHQSLMLPFRWCEVVAGGGWLPTRDHVSEPHLHLSMTR